MDRNVHWQLVGTSEGVPVEVDVREELIVGRGRDAGLVIDDGFVSRHHARLWIEEGVLRVEDLGSANGTFVDGVRLDKARRLQGGERLRFDRTTFRVEARTAPAAEDPEATVVRPPPGDERDRRPRVDADRMDQTLEVTPTVAGDDPLEDLDEFELPDTGATDADVAAGERSGDTVVLDPDQSLQSPADAAEPAPPADEPDSPAFRPGLLGVSGPLRGQLWELGDGRVRIGRGADCDIRVDADGVAEHHAELAITGTRVHLRSLAGEGAVTLGGTGIGDAELRAGDRIGLAPGVELRFDDWERLAPTGRRTPAWVWIFAAVVALALVGILVAAF